MLVILVDVSIASSNSPAGLVQAIDQGGRYFSGDSLGLIY
jgi:hypothetical protein